MRIVVEFADVHCPDAVELFNYEEGLCSFHLATVCGSNRTNDMAHDNAAIYTDTESACVTFRTYPREQTGKGFLLSYRHVDKDESMYSFIF